MPSAVAWKPLSKDARSPGTPAAEQLGTVIYKAAEVERLPGAELSNFWRNMDKERGIGLRTRVEKNLGSREPSMATPVLPVPSPQLESAQNHDKGWW